jgi:hypothetical protein
LRTDIVGSTIFYDFDIYQYLDHFYILVIVLPLLAAVLFLFLARWGPLASCGPRPLWPPLLSTDDATSTEMRALPAPTTQESARSAQPERRASLRHLPSAMTVAGIVARLALPALVIAAEVEIGWSPRVLTLSVARIGGGTTAAYLAVVITVAALIGRWRHQGIAVLSAANAVLAAAVVPMLLLVSGSTAVTVASDDRVVHYPWLPTWLAGAAAAVILVAVAVGLKRGGWKAARRVERLMLTIVVAPVALFLLTAVLQGAQGLFSGFDDSDATVGAQLMFAHGLWPWKDVLLLHGFLADGLSGAIGMWAFGATRWGSNSGFSFFVMPSTVICLYAFIAYFARRTWGLAVAGAFALVLGLLQNSLVSRYVLMLLVLIFFDMVLRQSSWRRCWLFMTAIVLTSIVTPEATILVLGVLLTLLCADLVHHRWGQPLCDGFRRTLRCAVAGATLTALWVAFLLVTGCLSGFVAYYATTVAGHELWGAMPNQWPFLGDVSSTVWFALPIALFLMTAAKVVWKLQRRSPWRPVEWVLVASATFVPLFYPVVLDRMDAAHVVEVTATLIPLVLLWGFELISVADRLIGYAGEAAVHLMTHHQARARRTGTVGTGGGRRRGFTPAALAVLVGVILWAPQSVATLKTIPGNFHPTVAAEPPAGLPLGYTVPGAIDTTQIEDLSAVLDRYAGTSAPVFDFSNELGILYFLLDRVPGDQFYTIQTAETAAAQQLAITDLRQSRPPVVIFNNTTFGLPDYDGIWSMERDYLVSQYLLDNYHPIVDVQGQLVMLRDDLVKKAPPPPSLKGASVTTGLYFASEPSCNWGEVPDFLDPPTAAEIGAGLPVTTEAGQLREASGWAFDSSANQPAAAVLATSAGTVIAQTEPSISRPDVAAALHDPVAALTGWTLPVVATPGAALGFFAMNSDGTVSPLAESGGAAVPSTIHAADGRVYLVVDRPDSGHVEQLTTSTTPVLNLSIPGSLSAYQWVEFHAPSGFGHATIQLTDQTLGTDASHVISFATLPQVGKTVYLRVGSCIQWHGYSTNDLHLLVQGAPSDMSLRVLP